MRPWIFIALLVVLVLALAVRPQAETITFYVQLVRGCDGDTPPEPNSRKVGPRIIEKVRGPLRWEGYWEIDRQEVLLVPGHATKVRLAKKFLVGIDLTDQHHRKVTASQNGRVIAKLCVPREGAMTVIGGNRDEQSSWFIVVRRDRPVLASN